MAAHYEDAGKHGEKVPSAWLEDMVSAAENNILNNNKNEVWLLKEESL